MADQPSTFLNINFPDSQFLSSLKINMHSEKMRGHLSIQFHLPFPHSWHLINVELRNFQKHNSSKCRGQKIFNNVRVTCREASFDGTTSKFPTRIGVRSQETYCAKEYDSKCWPQHSWNRIFLELLKKSKWQGDLEINLSKRKRFNFYGKHQICWGNLVSSLIWIDPTLSLKLFF